MGSSLDTDLDDLIRGISGLVAVNIERLKSSIRVDTFTGLIVVIQKDSINMRGGYALYEDWQERVEKWRENV